MQEEDAKYDNLFMTVLQQKGKIDGFFESLYGFLRRNTDFFLDIKKAEQVITDECKKQYQIYVETMKKKEEKEKEKKQREEQRKAQNPQSQPQQQAQPQQQTQPQPQQQTQPQPQQQTQPVETQQQQTSEQQATNKEDDDDNSPAPRDNGGKTDKYIWTQTLNDLHMYIPIHENIKAKQISVQFTLKHLKILIDKQPFIDSDFPENINPEDSLWTLENGEVQDYKGKYIHLSIEKWQNQMHWWDCALKGDTKINTKKINPESSKLSDLDGETRATVDKMMFDMRQKQAGKPTSDELKKQEMLSQFMKQHPEMDFSKCRFN